MPWPKGRPITQKMREALAASVTPAMRAASSERIRAINARRRLQREAQNKAYDKLSRLGFPRDQIIKAVYRGEKRAA
jgi:hypothetical protein